MLEESNRYLFTTAKEVMQHTFESVTIQNLLDRKKDYNNYPEYQRGYVWPLKYAQAYIDTILRGLPSVIPIITVRVRDEQLQITHQVIDGQQKLRTIYNFANGDFACWTAGRCKLFEPKLDGPIEPGRRFYQLSEPAQNIFLNYPITIHHIDGTSQENIRTLFRRLQYHIPLTAAEQLASYTSKAVTYARKLQHHPIWNSLYIGKNRSQETFEGSLMIIALEVSGSFADLINKPFREFASGSKDELLTPSCYDTIEERLDVVAKVFDGAVFRRREAIIPMYQSIMLLEKQKYTLISSDRHILVPWLGQVISQADQKARDLVRSGYMHPLKGITRVDRQQSFWEQHFPSLIKQLNASRASAT